MRRVQALIVILALASLPAIVLAQNGGGPACNGMCCLRHAMHMGGAHADGMSCHHGAAGHVFECGMHSNQRAQNATLAPLPPTMLSASATLPEPVIIRGARASDTKQTLPGFLAVPFEPPRS